MHCAAHDTARCPAHYSAHYSALLHVRYTVSCTAHRKVHCIAHCIAHCKVRCIAHCILPWAETLVTLRCKLKSRPGLALGPLGAPEYESRVNSRSRVPLPIFFCRSDHPEWWSLAEVHGCLDVDSPNP